MDRFASFGKLHISNNFIMDTPQHSPNPQASSTAMKGASRKNMREFNTVSNEISSEFHNISSTSSSLGVLDVNTVSDFTDDSIEFKSRFENFEKFLENEQSSSRSRMSKRLDEISSRLSSQFSFESDDSNDDGDGDDEISLISENLKKTVSTHTRNNKSEQSASNTSATSFGLDNSHKLSQLSSGTSTFSFVSGSQAELKFEQDQKTNKKEFGSVPVTPADSILSDEYTKSGATDYLGAGSYSVADIEDVLRNRLKSDGIKNTIKPIERYNLVGGTFDKFRESKLTSSILSNDTYDTSAISSIASFNQIVKILQEQSTEPELLTERLLTKGVDTDCDGDSIASSNLDSDSQSTTKSTIGSVKRATVLNSEFNDKSIPNTANNLSAPRIPFDETSPSLKFEKRPNCVPEKGYFRLMKTASDFEVCDMNDDSSECSSVSSYMCLNATPNINSENDLNDTLASPFTAKLVKASRIKDNSNQSNLLTSKSMTTSSSVVEPVKEISSVHNVAKPNNDLVSPKYSKNLDKDEEEIINAGSLCIGTQVKVVLGITNPSRKILNYRIKLNSITVDGKPNINAALVMTSSSSVAVFSTSDTEVSIVITPVVCAAIIVTLEFTSQDKMFPDIIKRVQIIGQDPSLKLIRPENLSLYYGLLAEYTQKRLPIILNNDSELRIPIRFTIFEGSESNDVIYVARTTLEPNQLFECDVLVMTPEVAFKLDKDSANTIELIGKLCIMVDVAEDKALQNFPPIHTIHLSAKVGFTNISIKNPTPLKLFTSGYPKWSVSENLSVENSGVIPLVVVAKIYGDDGKEFSVEPAHFKLAPFHQDTIKLNFKPVTNDVKRKVDVCFVAQNSRKRFIVPVYGIIEESVVSSSSPKHDLPVPSNPSTPRSGSSSSSSTYAEGSLELACTHSVLVWSSSPVHQKQMESIVLRNKAAHREKLVLAITDNFGSFKFVENDNCVKEMKITLEAGESRKIMVAFIPYVADKQVSGKIKICRRNCLESSTAILNKRVLPLYGYGGDAKISIQNVFRDSEGRIWLNPDTDTLDAKFVIENVGDAVAFVKIVQEEPDDVMYPEEMLLCPSESAEVTFKLRLTTDRVDLLCNQNRSKDILVVNKLVIFYGCEATRQRINRLWLKLDNINDFAIRRVADKIDVISNFGQERASIKVNELLDPLSSLNKLWYEGITEEVVGILIDRESLESLSLDTTVIFNDLNATLSIP